MPGTSLIEADTNRQNSSSQTEWDSDKIISEDAPRAVREYLATLDEAALVQPLRCSPSSPPIPTRHPSKLQRVQALPFLPTPPTT